MKQPSLPGLRLPVLLLPALLFFSNSYSQPGLKATNRIDWSKDTISANAATSASTKLRNELNNAGKKATKIISLPVDKLKEIMDACAANGVADVKVLIVSIGAEDAEHYGKRNPEFSAADKKDIIGRQTVIIRVPRAAFAEASGSGKITPLNNKLMVSLLTAGLVMLDKPFAELPQRGDDIYFSIGNICPPPTSCDN